MKKNVIDLFAGVGGLSLGAARAGFSVTAAVEIDAKAMAAHQVNFPGTAHLSEDVSALGGDQLLKLAGLRPGELSGLVGGPPCQGFSEIGLRSHADPRNQLLVDFFRLANETQPAFFMAENVPGVLLTKNANVLAHAYSQLSNNYVQLEPIVVKASDYGAPTSRTRVFFIGFDPEKIGRVAHADFSPKAKSDVRVRDALKGLPAIRSDWQAEAQGWRAVERVGGSDFEQRVGGNVPEGVGCPSALERYRMKREVSGFLGTVHTDDTVQRFKRLKHGERDSVSKAQRLDPDGYCPTIRAGTGPERGSYQAVRPVHPSSPRVIAPREAARLQGFPDWFQFHGTKWHAFRQIGNSVSPIVAEALLGVLAAAAS